MGTLEKVNGVWMARLPAGPYVLRRDGKPVATGGWFDLLRYVHERHSFSFDWALKNEGFSVDRLTP